VPPDARSREPWFRLAGIYELTCPHTLVVNKQGRRFADETYFQHMAPRLREFDPDTHTYPNLPCFLVFDQQFVDTFAFAGWPVGEIPDWVHRADTLDELAATIGVDEVGLRDTVSRFNGFVAAGVDDDFARGALSWSLAERGTWGRAAGANRTLGTVDKAPFFAVELHPSAFAASGVSTDAVARVLDQRQQVIPGLYAVGNTSAHTEYGIGYQAGYSFASGLTFGYLAANDIAGVVAPGLTRTTPTEETHV
jgi:3-oxosteroid 1-dehydrogenase